MSNDRSWMYRRLEDGGLGIRLEFIEGVRQFIGFALDHPECMFGEKIRCPCCICMNRKLQTQERLKTHLYKKEFKPNYTIRVSQEENDPSIFRQQSTSSQQPMPPNNEPVLVEEKSNPYIDMVMDMAGPGFDWEEQLPNADAQKCFDLLEAEREKLYEGCKTYMKLSAAAQLLTHKSEANMSENAFDNFMSTFGRMFPKGANIPKTLYEAKKIVAKLGLSLQKIDACPNDCMLYYKSTVGLTECSECGYPRYKPMRRGSRKHKNIPFKVLRYLPLAPRLQRFFMSTTTAKHIRWHKEFPRERGVLSHPSDDEAWKHFDRTYPYFSFDARNVRLCASADGFDPFSNSTKPYSCWPVIVTPYNLPPWMAMKQEY